jgi:cell division transport system ATP-binding protein
LRPAARITADASAEDFLIRFQNVGLRYGFGPEILRDLSFRIDSNSFQFLTGPSGAGKTSLLRMLFLSLKQTRGLISMFDQDTATLTKDDRARLRRRIGIVFQDFRLLDHLTTYENISLPFRVLGKDESEYRNEVVELLRWVGLGERMDALPPVLSGGEKQRAAIARAVIARPQLLLADRQCRSQSGSTPAAPVHRTEQIGHVGRHRHPRHCIDGRVRRPPACPARGAIACLRVSPSTRWQTRGTKRSTAREPPAIRPPRSSRAIRSPAARSPR